MYKLDPREILILAHYFKYDGKDNLELFKEIAEELKVKNLKKIKSIEESEELIYVKKVSNVYFEIEKMFNFEPENLIKKRAFQKLVKNVNIHLTGKALLSEIDSYLTSIHVDLRGISFIEPIIRPTFVVHILNAIKYLNAPQ